MERTADGTPCLQLFLSGPPPLTFSFAQLSKPSPFSTMSENFTDVAEDIAKDLRVLKNLDFDHRYDIYAELFREGLATDAGYMLLPTLWQCLGEISDRIDLEVAYIIGSIQNSFLNDSDSASFEVTVSPYLHRDRLLKIIDCLSSGRHLCYQNLPWEQCQELITALSERCSGQA